jgi:aspartyl-tRNA(Asn)/glutamyl-tRNA(Gln) amidotransferase subunit A
VNEPDAPAPPAEDTSAVTLVDMCRAIRERRVSPVELVTDALHSLQDWQPVTNATSQLFAEQALGAARALPARPIGPLHGIPILVKELFDVAEHETTGCSEAFRGKIASSDAFVVQRLREAGAVIVGKANMHELAASGTNHISSCGPTKNP